MCMGVYERPNAGYTAVSNRLIDQKPVKGLFSADEKFFLIVLIRHMNNDSKLCFPSESTITSKLGIGHVKFCRLRKALEEKGLISVKHRFQRNNEYSLGDIDAFLNTLPQDSINQNTLEEQDSITRYSLEEKNEGEILKPVSPDTFKPVSPNTFKPVSPNTPKKTITNKTFSKKTSAFKSISLEGDEDVLVIDSKEQENRKAEEQKVEELKTRKAGTFKDRLKALVEKYKPEEKTEEFFKELEEKARKSWKPDNWHTDDKVPFFDETNRNFKAEFETVARIWGLEKDDPYYENTRSVYEKVAKELNPNDLIARTRSAYNKGCRLYLIRFLKERKFSNFLPEVSEREKAKRQNSLLWDFYGSNFMKLCEVAYDEDWNSASLMNVVEYARKYNISRRNGDLINGEYVKCIGSRGARCGYYDLV